MTFRLNGVNWASEVAFGDGEPCMITGCRHHVKHPCEMCGRYQARGEAKVRTGFLIIKQEEVSTSG